MPEEEEINEVRYRKFCKEKTPEPHQLSPTRDELIQHIKRANYQSFVWKRALLANPDISTPVGNGWSLNEDKLDIVWMEKLPAIESILELVTCDYRGSKCSGSCQCKILSLDCTCRKNCENVSYNDHSDTDEEKIDK